MAILVVLAIGIGFWQTKSRNEGHADPVSKVIRLTVDEPSGLVSLAASNTSDFFYGLVHSGGLTADNRRLRQIAQAEALYNFRLSEDQVEIDNLRKLLGMPTYPGKTRIVARVIGTFPDENRITLNVGSSAGLIPGIPVVAPDGLVGVIQTVDSHTSQAILIESPLPFKIGAIVVHTPESAGLLHGESASQLMLDLNLGSPVDVGDLVVSSGFSEKIPRGIPIGRVTAVQQDQDFGIEHAEISPSARVGESQEVFILK